MNKGWKKIKIKDIADIKKGNYITKNESKPGPYPVILGGQEPAYYINKYNHQGKAIVISRSGASAGYVSFWNENIYVTDGFLIEPKDNISYEYLYYLLKSKQNELHNMQRGAAIPHVTPTLLYEVDIELPPFATREKVCSILRNYDNLIENNQAQIKLLEEAAQRLYKEWFVDLRFPEHEKVEVVDGVPMGWKRKTVLECLEMHIGGGWGKETVVGKNMIPGKVIRGTDINNIKAGNYRDIPLRYHTENDIKTRSLRNYDIVFELSNGNINNIGRCLLVDNAILQNCGKNAICASFCKLFRPLDKLHALTLYLEIQDMQASGRMAPFKKQGSNGINNFAFEDFLTHEFLIPSDDSFITTLESIVKKISNIQSQFALLSQARDRLLPKLMSGELEV